MVASAIFKAMAALIKKMNSRAITPITTNTVAFGQRFGNVLLDLEFHQLDPGLDVPVRFSMIPSSFRNFIKESFSTLVKSEFMQYKQNCEILGVIKDSF